MSTPTTVHVAVPTPRQRQVEQIVDVTVIPDDRLLLSIPEAAHRIGVSRSQLYNLIASGQIPVVHIGRSARIRAAALGEFVGGLG